VTGMTATVALNFQRFQTGVSSPRGVICLSTSRTGLAYVACKMDLGLSVFLDLGAWHQRIVVRLVGLLYLGTYIH